MKFIKIRSKSIILMFVFFIWSMIGQQNMTFAASIYTSPEGIRFISASPAWNQENKLKSLYEELLKNTHGEEIKLLSEVKIYDDYPQGKSIAGEYQFQTSVDLLGKQKILPGKIALYGGNERTTVESVARTLAHEYGHHVTHYYSLKQDGISITDETRWQQTTYAKIRGLSGDSRVNQTKEHRWQLAEIAAEDYVQLFGSPTSKTINEFPSRFEQLQKNKELPPLRWDASMFNVVPQENYELPLASEIPGLYQWMAKSFGVKEQLQVPKEPDLQVKEVRKVGQEDFQIQFQWSEANKDANLFYTLVTYGKEDQLPEPIVTRNGKEPLTGTYGTMVIKSPTSILTYKDPNATGIRHFQVYAQNQAGFVSASKVLTLDMKNPSQVTITEPEVNQSQQVDSVKIQMEDSMNNIQELSTWAQKIFHVVEMGFELISELISRVIEEVIKFIS